MISRMKSKKEIIKPAIAVPLGLRNKPPIESAKPTSQTIHPNTGIHDKKKPTMATIKPAKPILFFPRQHY